ncbi:MAG: ribosome silencing factor [Chloroflexi bacterium]|nr:MAG: ribosome silencing factor [Chloroflexota bacterium]TMF38767.1 MAG: ribosome silencing factor [Chloroflexota bacterium]
MASPSPTACRRRWSPTSPKTTSIWIIRRLAAERTKRLTPLQLARLLRSAAAEKKAWDPVVLDVRDQTSVADYFVICEGETDRQVRAIADAMVEAAKARDRRPLAVDGYDDAGWILLDFDSVLAHVFLPGERSYYDLESLWAPAAKRRRKAASA